MAETKKVTLKRFNGTDQDTIHPKTEWDQIESKPATFTPTAHTLNSHTDVNAVPTANGQVLTWDADNSVWVASTTAGGGVSKADLQNLYIYGKASAAITKGQAIQFAGAQGDHILIKPAVQSEINANPDYMIGIAETDALANDFIYVLVNGRLILDTSTYTAGTILWFDSAGSTPGALTATEPTSTAAIQMAAVSISGVGNGEFVIRTNLISRNIHEVIGLQAALDAKVDLAGDTMTGNLRIDSGSFASLILDREGDTSSSNVIQFENNNGIVGGIGGFGNDGLQFRTTDGTQMVIDASNNVGIGTTSPSGKLDILSSGQDIFKLRHDAGSGGNWAINPYISGINNAGLSFNDRRNSTTPLVISDGGNVGIGTTSPGNKLVVETSTVADSLVINNTSTAVQAGNNFGLVVKESGTDKIYLRYRRDNSGVAELYNVGNSKLALGTNNSEKMTIDATGNVGIGTSSPTAKLDVLGSANASTLYENGTALSSKYYLASNPSGYQTAAQVSTAISNLVASAPTTLDTLNELAAALGDDPNFATTVTNSIATKVSKSGDTMTGALSTSSYLEASQGVASWNGTLNIDTDYLDRLWATSIGTETTRGTKPANYYHYVNLPSNGTTRGLQFAGYYGSNNALYVRTKTDSGSAWLSWERLFSDNYHPNADKLTTARNIALTGAVTGNANFDGSGNISIATTATADPTLTISGDGSGSATFTNLGNASLSLTNSFISERAAITYGAGGLQWTDQSGLGGAGTNGAAPANPTNEWWHHLVMNHANAAGYYFDIAAAFHSDSIYFRRNVAGSLQSWQQMFHDGYHPNADTLTTARTINGTSFNGSANITTANWGTARTLTIGNTGKSVNGSGNVSWSLAEIGAQPAGSYLTTSGSQQIVKNAHTSGASDYHLELYSNNVNASGEVSLRMHQGGQWWGQIRLRSDGFHFTQGADNSYRNVYAGTFYGALSGNASSATNADTVDGLHASSFWQKSGSWLGDLGSNGYTREIGLSMTGGSEFVVLSKSGQGSVLVDGHYLSYESNNGFFGSYDSAYGNLTGIQATAANTLTVKQLDGGGANLTVNGDIKAQGNFYGKDGSSYSNIYKIGGVYFSWDNNTYGTQTNHSIRSTYGDTYGDHITLNSYGHIRMNIDSNNNGTNYFEVGGHTTGTSNTWFRVTDTGPSYFYSSLGVSGSLTRNGNTVWDAGNDGSGSGLDADLLDGQHASAFSVATHTHNGVWETIKSGSSSTIASGTSNTTVTVSQSLAISDVIAFELISANNGAATNQVFIVKLEDGNDPYGGILYNAYASNTLIRMGSIRVYRDAVSATTLRFTYAYYADTGSATEVADIVYVGNIWKLTGVTGY